jgi:drug/metabolite transporter (DMT)-like permease
MHTIYMKKNRKLNGEFFFENFWRLLTNAWTSLFIVLVVADFFFPDRYGRLVTPVALLYGAVLSIFVGTKEFGRWYVDRRDERHPGELYVVFWSVLVVAMAAYAAFVDASRSVSSDVVSAYIMVLTVFAITQASKHARRKKRK